MGFQFPSIRLQRPQVILESIHQAHPSGALHSRPRAGWHHVLDYRLGRLPRRVLGQGLPTDSKREKGTTY